jgi:hypothetical protein
MRLGAPVLAISANNKAGDWLTLEEAVASGVPFAIRVAEDVLAIDCDDLAQAPLMEILDGMLSAGGHEPLLLISGQGLHLWCVVQRPVRLERYRHIAKALGLDVRSGTMMRPPGSPHRLGLPCVRVARDFSMAMWRLPRMLEARGFTLRGDGNWRRRVLEGLDRLAPESEHPVGPTASPAPPQRWRRPLDGKCERLLRKGARHGQRSEAIQSLTLAAYSRGWTNDDCFQVIIHNKLGEKIREQGGEAAQRRYFDTCWKKAVRYTEASRAQVQAEVAGLRTAMEAYPWRPRSGTTDRAVLDEHLDIVESTGKLQHTVSVRDLADAVGFIAQTMSESHSRLIASGLVVAG